eukprot:6201176-Pleurochrysis_carterae.AAC.4
MMYPFVCWHLCSRVCPRMRSMASGLLRVVAPDRAREAKPRTVSTSPSRVILLSFRVCSVFC